MSFLIQRCVCVVQAVLLNATGPASLAASLLSHPGWEIPAQLSYGTYLLHPLVLLWVSARLLPVGFLSVSRPSSIAIQASLVFVGSYPLAYCLHRWVEVPCYALAVKGSARPAAKTA